jgi:hypothetical protein
MLLSLHCTPLHLHFLVHKFLHCLLAMMLDWCFLFFCVSCSLHLQARPLVSCFLIHGAKFSSMEPCHHRIQLAPYLLHIIGVRLLLLCGHIGSEGDQLHAPLRAGTLLTTSLTALHL